MKNTVFTLLAGVTLLCSCQTHKTKVTGTLEGVGSDTVIVLGATMPAGHHIGDSDEIQDTIALQQGRFCIEVGTDTLPIQLAIIEKPAGNKALNFAKHIYVLAFPGESLTINGTMDDYQITGSDFYTAYNKVQAELKPMTDSIKSLTELAVEMQKNEASEDSIAALLKSVQDINKRITDKTMEYIRRNPDEDVSVFLASFMDGEHAIDALPLIGMKARNGSLSALYRHLDKSIKDLQARKEAQENISEGNLAPDFTLKDLQGNDLSLSSLRGKYVVLDFWGSWCGWCIKGIPDMKKYYEKYRDKMEILGIDCRDTEEKWKEAVEKYELPWLHVRNTGTPDVSILYAISGYPTKIVIDPEGKIAKVIIGESPEFYEYLDELFK